MRAILDILLIVLNLYWWIVIIAAVLSWLIAFSIINLHNDLVRSIWNGLSQLTEPVFARVRAFLPNLGNVDISPIIVLLAIELIKRIIIYYLYPNVF